MSLPFIIFSTTFGKRRRSSLLGISLLRDGSILVVLVLARGIASQWGVKVCFEM